MISRLLVSISSAAYGVYPSREEGQGMAEYGLILAFASIVAATAIIFLGGGVSRLIGRVSASLDIP